MYFNNIIGQDFAKKYLTNSIKKIKHEKFIGDLYPHIFHIAE